MEKEFGQLDIVIMIFFEKKILKNMCLCTKDLQQCKLVNLVN